MEGRSIGDEYQYIIDRRYATKFPGNMLRRPSLLLNPWAIRKTETSQQTAATGDDFSPSDATPDPSAQRPGGKKGQSGQRSGFANLDYLAGRSAVLVNLVPDEKGMISIKREAVRANSKSPSPSA